MTQRSVLGVNSNIATRWLYCIECPQYSTRRRILYFKKIRSVCPSVSAMVSASINPLPSDRLRCCDRYIRCHRLLAVKPLEVQGNTRGGGWERAELLAAYRQSVIRSLSTLQPLEPSDCCCTYRPVELGRYPLFEIE